MLNWAHFWLPFGALWLTLGSLWLTFGSLLAPFGSLLVPLGSLLLTLALDFLTFGASWRHFSYFCVPSVEITLVNKLLPELRRPKGPSSTRSLR